MPPLPRLPTPTQTPPSPLPPPQQIVDALMAVSMSCCHACILCNLVKSNLFCLYS
ncbi:unnamed protein product [Protopolystoma xenopodis]|uniref:Uncharacterized protein n=1 Tax=Protopolystoma xenopodis TaxID=117903 RepID=A0A448XIV3_9PLAT|nr:unnamed protein product [Protopolystoma xenopodis]